MFKKKIKHKSNGIYKHDNQISSGKKKSKKKNLPSH